MGTRRARHASCPFRGRLSGALRPGSVALLVGLLWIAVATAVSAQESCLKLVFGRYCLGGDVSALLRQTPQPLVNQSEGERRALIYNEGRDDLYVLAFRNRIYKVLWRYGTATQLRYDDLYGLLHDKYGPGQDQSRFAVSANTPGRRLAAIRRGEGRAIHRWTPATTWHIELSWTREMGLALAYVDTAANESQKAALTQGY